MYTSIYKMNSDALTRVVFVKAVLTFACASSIEICRGMRVNSSWLETLTSFGDDIWDKAIDTMDIRGMIRYGRFENIKRSINAIKPDFYGLIWWFTPRTITRGEEEIYVYLIRHKFKEAEEKADFADTYDKRLQRGMLEERGHSVMCAGLAIYKALHEVGCNLTKYVKDVEFLAYRSDDVADIAEFLLSVGVPMAPELSWRAFSRGEVRLSGVLLKLGLYTPSWVDIKVAEGFNSREMLTLLVNHIGIDKVRNQSGIPYMISLIGRGQKSILMTLLAGKSASQVVNSIFKHELSMVGRPPTCLVPDHFLKDIVSFPGVKEEINQRMQSKGFRKLMFSTFGERAYNLFCLE